MKILEKKWMSLTKKPSLILFSLFILLILNQKNSGELRIKFLYKIISDSFF